MRTVYVACIDAMAAGDVDLTSDTLKAVLVTADYTFSASHDSYADLTGVVAEQALSTVTFTGGVLEAADTTFTAVATGSTVTGVVVYDDTHASNLLVAYISTKTDGSAISIVTADDDIVINWNDGEVAHFYPGT